MMTVFESLDPGRLDARLPLNLEQFVNCRGFQPKGKLGAEIHFELCLIYLEEGTSSSLPSFLTPSVLPSLSSFLHSFLLFHTKAPIAC